MLEVFAAIGIVAAAAVTVVLRIKRDITPQNSGTSTRCSGCTSESACTQLPHLDSEGDHQCDG